EVGPPLREVIEHRHAMGELGRMVVRHQEPTGPDAHAGRLHQCLRDQEIGRRMRLPRRRVMLADPRLAEAELVRPPQLLEIPPVAVVQTALGRMRRHREQSVVHQILLGPTQVRGFYARSVAGDRRAGSHVDGACRARYAAVLMALPVAQLPRTRRWTRVEYDRLIELGVFRPDERLELLDGLLVVREPRGSRHAAIIRRVIAALRHALGGAWQIDSQLPIALDADSEPEPDISVVPRDPRAYKDAHPTHAVLIVEIAESSYRPDRD